MTRKVGRIEVAIPHAGLASALVRADPDYAGPLPLIDVMDFNAGLTSFRIVVLGVGGEGHVNREPTGAPFIAENEDLILFDLVVACRRKWLRAVGN